VPLLSVSKQWGRVSGTPNDYFIWDGVKGYEVQVNTNLPIQFKNSALFAVANILTDAENVVDEKAECCNLGQGILTVKIASSHQDQTLIACYFILGYLQWGTADCNKYFVLPLKYPDRYIMVATFLTMSSNITNELAVKIDSLSTARINCSLNEQVTSPQAVWISIGV